MCIRDSVGTVRNDPLQRHGLLLVADDVDIGSAIRQFIRNAFVTDEVDHLAGLSCKGGQHGKYAGIDVYKRQTIPLPR